MENNQNHNVQRGQTPMYARGSYFVPQSVPYKKEYSPLTKKENSFIFITLAGLFVFVDFSLLFRGFNLGFTISYALIFLITTAFIYKKNAKNKAFSVVCGALSLILSVGNTLFNNSFIKPVSVLIICFLFAIYCLGISGGNDKPAGSYRFLIDLFLKTVAAPFENLENVFGGIKAGAKKSKGVFGVLLGIILALPVLIVVIPLLVSSDAAFEGLIESILQNIGIYLLEFAIAIFLLPFFYSYLLSRERSIEKKQDRKSDKKELSSSICISFLSVISVTYIVYLFSQLAYFFSAFKGILPDGYTHTASAFARRGFYEMFAICVINIAIVSAVSILCERKKKKLPVFIKALSTFISLFSVLLIIIAMQKMRLNIATYGLSVNRILVCAFMLMMLFVIAFFILHIFAPKVKYMQAIIIICAVIFIGLTFSDIDRIAAEYNINAYTSGELEKLDIEAISNMSDSAVPYLIELTKSEDKKIAKKTKEETAKKILSAGGLYRDKKTVKLTDEAKDFREYNRAKINSLKIMKEYFDSLSEKEKQKIIVTYNL